MTILRFLWSGVVVLCISFSFFVLHGIAEDRQTFATAEQVRADGVDVVANEVLIDRRYSRRHYPRAVLVTFPVAEGQSVKTELTGWNERVNYSGFAKWSPPAADSIYRPPLRVRYLPSQPRTAFAVSDLENVWDQDPTSVAVVGATLFALPPALTLLVIGVRIHRSRSSRR